MAESYLRHFGLTKVPFSKEVTDADLWLPSSKQETVEELVEAAEARESVAVIGEQIGRASCRERV